MTLAVILVVLAALPAWAQQEKVANAKIVTKTHDAYTAKYRAVQDREIRSEGMTEAEYTALALPNSATPQHKTLPNNKTWVFQSAAKNDVYSTPSGRLEPGNIYFHNKNEALLEQADDAPLSLPLATYSITQDGQGRPNVVPDPPGLAIKDGEVRKKGPQGGPGGNP